MNYIITNNKSFFEKIGNYNYCNLSEMVLPDTIGFDTETTSLKPFAGDVFSIQIGTGQDNYLIDLQKLGGEITFEEVIPFLKDKKLVGHNLTFDLGWCYKHNFYPTKVFDTFIASKILYNGDKNIYRHDFGTVMERELNLIYDKTEQQNIARTQLSNHKAITYAFNDVDRILDLLNAMGTKIKRKGQLDTFLLHNRYIKALAYIESCGLPIDEQQWLNKIELDKEVFKENERKVIEYIYEHLPQYRDLQIDMFSNEKRILPSLSSALQMIPVFKDFGINVKSDTEPDKETIAENIISKSDHEFVKIWLEFQGSLHDLTTFGANILEKVENGRIYTNYNPILDTARISTRKGDVNVLNLPANQRTRDCFRAKEGYKMIVSDYEGQENAVLAGKSLDSVMIDSVVNGADLHCAFARMIFPLLRDLSDDEIKNNHKDKRNFAKPSRFALAYGGNGYTIAMNQNLPVEEGERIEKLYKELHSGVYEWGEAVLQESIEKGYIASCMGFRLYLPFFEDFKKSEYWIKKKDSIFWEQYRKGKEEYKKKAENTDYVVKDDKSYKHYIRNKGMVSDFFRQKSKYFRLCLNNPIQTTAAHQTKLAVAMLFEEILKNNHIGDVKICVVPHDEIVLEVKEELAEKYKLILENCMRQGGDEVLGSEVIKMKADANIGDSWYEAK